MKADQQVYIRLRHRLEVLQYREITLQDISQIIAPQELEQELSRLVVYTLTPEDQHLAIIDVMQVVAQMKKRYSYLEIEAIGPSQTILEMVGQHKASPIPFVLVICLLLFVGSGLAIMNFHEDVSMLAVHQKVYRMLTGESVEHPLLLQIPYSLGIGLGMILFFNHVFRKRFNEEPSPLEVEMFLYQQNLDHYVSIKENKEAEKKLT